MARLRFELTTPGSWGHRSTNWAIEEIFVKVQKLIIFKNIFAIMTKPEGAWPNLSSNQAIRANLVYIVSLHISKTHFFHTIYSSFLQIFLPKKLEDRNEKITSFFFIHGHSLNLFSLLSYHTYFFIVMFFSHFSDMHMIHISHEFNLLINNNAVVFICV